MKKEYTFTSVLAPYIRNYLTEKRSLGFLYRNNEYYLYKLDCYWVEKGYTTVSISKEQLDPWLYPSGQKGKVGIAHRCGAVRGFASYMNALGHKCYVPIVTVKIDKPVPHIFSSEELKELFAAIDSYQPETDRPKDRIAPTECRVILRMLYCCGMRINEACKLRTSDVDLENGVVTIMNGKNQKDRLVYLPDDLTDLMKGYFEKLKNDIGCTPVWFFPCRSLKSHIYYGRVEELFNICWNRTDASKHCGKKPTVHSLRHTFVVNRINIWASQGVDLAVMLTYLAKYLGHKSPNETYYYYHLVKEAFEVVRKKDASAEKVIPEVKRI